MVRFLLSTILKKDVTKIKNLDTFKASQENDIPTKIIKENTIFSNFIHQSFNNMIDICIFFNIFLQLANMVPVFEKGPKNPMENYGPVSSLPSISKIYKKCHLTNVKLLWKHIFRNFKMALDQVSMHNIAWCVWLM